MRTLQVIRSLDPACGGTVEAVRQLSAAMQSEGHRVEVACLDGSDAPWLHSWNVPVHACGPGMFGYGLTPGFPAWLRQRAHQYDAVLVNGIWEFHSVAVRSALQHTHTPYFVFPHGMLDPWFQHSYPLKHLKKSLYWPFCGYPVLRDARAVVFTAEEERRRAGESFPLKGCREQTVLLGCPAPPSDAMRQREVFLQSFPHLAGKRILLMMGRLHPKKGCDLAIEAFASEFRDRQDWHLVLAGPDSMGWLPNLQALATQHGIKHQITWTGMLGGDLRWGAYRLCEALLLPSHSENFGMVIPEALACGKPVLISDQVNIWREIEQAGAGLVQTDSLTGTRVLLRQWKQMPAAERELMNERALRCFQYTFEIDRAAAALVSCIEEELRWR